MYTKSLVQQLKSYRFKIHPKLRTSCAARGGLVEVEGDKQSSIIGGSG